MTKQEALKKLTILVENGFYFEVNECISLTSKADNILYRARSFVEFEAKEVWEGSINDWGKYQYIYAYDPVFVYSGVYSNAYTNESNTYFSNNREYYGEDAELVSFEEMEALLRILESEEETQQSSLKSLETLSVKAANQTELGKVGVSLELGIVNHILTVEEAKELNKLLVEVLDQFTLELSIGDVVSDNDQSLVVCGINGKNIWCENGQSGQFFTKKRDELFLINKYVQPEKSGFQW